MESSSKINLMSANISHSWELPNLHWEKCKSEHKTLLWPAPKEDQCLNSLGNRQLFTSSISLARSCRLCISSCSRGSPIAGGVHIHGIFKEEIWKKSNLTSKNVIYTVTLSCMQPQATSWLVSRGDGLCHHREPELKWGKFLPSFKRFFFPCNLEGFPFDGLTTVLSLLSASEHRLDCLTSCITLLKAGYICIYK